MFLLLLWFHFTFVRKQLEWDMIFVLLVRVKISYISVTGLSGRFVWGDNVNIHVHILLSLSCVIKVWWRAGKQRALNMLELILVEAFYLSAPTSPSPNYNIITHYRFMISQDSWPLHLNLPLNYRTFFSMFFSVTYNLVHLFVFSYSTLSPLPFFFPFNNYRFSFFLFVLMEMERKKKGCRLGAEMKMDMDMRLGSHEYMILWYWFSKL